MFMPFFDWRYFVFVGLPLIVLSFLASNWVKRTYQRYSQVRSSSGLTGVDIARRILTGAGLSDGLRQADACRGRHRRRRAAASPEEQRATDAEGETETGHHRDEHGCPGASDQRDGCRPHCDPLPLADFNAVFAKPRLMDDDRRAKQRYVRVWVTRRARLRPRARRRGSSARAIVRRTPAAADRRRAAQVPAR